MLYLLVTGSRNWDDEAFIWAQLTRLYILHGGIQIHHGDCPEGGADQIADEWGNAFNAVTPKVSVVKHPMDRRRFGKKAGPIRNSEMVVHIADLMSQGRSVACHGFNRDRSRGTSDCTRKAMRAGIPTVSHAWINGYAIKTVTDDRLFPLEFVP